MFKKKQIYFALIVFFAFSGVVRAADTGTSAPQSVKSYTLTNLQQVVSNGPKCAPFYSDLEKLTQNPVSLQFTPQAEDGKHATQDSSGQLLNHHFAGFSRNVFHHIHSKIGKMAPDQWNFFRF